MVYEGKEIWKLQVVWGVQRGVVLVPSGLELFVLRNEIVILGMSEKSTDKEKNAFLKKSLKNLLKEEIQILLPKWEEITGLKCSSWFIGKGRSAWGWCNTATGRIMLNENLIYKPKECLEYVILHELCHLKEGNHGKRFGELLDKYMPDWKDKEVLNNGVSADYGR